jgi:hypothetical protein
MIDPSFDKMRAGPARLPGWIWGMIGLDLKARPKIIFMFRG